MSAGEKRKNLYVSIFIAIFCAYMGYLICGCTVDGQLSILSVMNRFGDVVNKPIANYWNSYSFTGIIIGGLLGIYLAAFYYYTRKKWMWGKEQGSAEWEDPKEITRKLAPSNKEIKKQAKEGKVELVRQISANVRYSMDDGRTRINNNILLLAGPGKGKTFRIIAPILMQCLGSMIITDPKKEVLRTYGNYLIKHGYEVRVLDLIDFELSDQYNPFMHIQDQEDIPDLVELLWKSMEDPKAQKGEPIWDDSAKSLVEGLVYYIFLEMSPEERNFRTLIDMLTELSLGDEQRENMKNIMLALRKENPSHPAAIKYLSAMNGADDTVKSVLFSATGRLAPLTNEKLLRIFDGNSIDFKALGMGVDGDKTKKTALFFAIKDGDTRWNFVLSLAYMQAFRELYYEADHNCGDNRGRLPIPVTCLLDEFRNVPLPNTYPQLLSTMRGRNINSIITIQDLSQLEQLYEKEHKTIRQDCDVTIYMGGNEQETHKWVSERIGKATIDKRSQGRSYGHNGSDSRNDDILGREMMMPDEVAKLPDDELIIFISGYGPIKDKKYKTELSREFAEAMSYGNYTHTPKRPVLTKEEKEAAEANESKEEKEERKKKEVSKSSGFEQINEKQTRQYEQAAERGVAQVTKMPNQMPFMLKQQKRIAQVKYFSDFAEDKLELINKALENGVSPENLKEMLDPGMAVGQIRAVLSGFFDVKL